MQLWLPVCAWIWITEYSQMYVEIPWYFWLHLAVRVITLTLLYEICGLFSCICSSMYISLRWGAELFITSNSLWPSDIIWMHRTGAKWVQLMACCLMAPSHYLDQYWLINKVLWHSPEGDFTGNAQDSYSWCGFENKRLKNTARYPRHQWVNFKCNLSIDWSVKRDLTPSV